MLNVKIQMATPRVSDFCFFRPLRHHQMNACAADVCAFSLDRHLQWQAEVAPSGLRCQALVELRTDAGREAVGRLVAEPVALADGLKLRSHAQGILAQGKDGGLAEEYDNLEVGRMVELHSLDAWAEGTNLAVEVPFLALAAVEPFHGLAVGPFRGLVAEPFLALAVEPFLAQAAADTQHVVAEGKTAPHALREALVVAAVDLDYQAVQEAATARLLVS